MSIIHTAVRRPVGTAMIYVGVLVVGLAALRLLSVDLLPQVDFPRISIVTLYEGVGSEEIETLVTRRIEQAVSTIEGVSRLEAVSSEGISRVQLQFDWGTHLDTAVNDVRANLDRLGGQLPDGADRPVVYKFDLSSIPVAFVGLGGSGDPRRLRYLADETLSRRLERLTGVAAVSVQGGRVREIRVALVASRLISQGVSASQVIQALARDNRNVSAGEMSDAGRDVLVRTVGEWASPADVERVLVTVRNGRPIYIRDLGRVRDTFKEVRADHWVDGQRGITMRISKQSGANTVEVVGRLRAELQRINDEYDGRLRLSMLWDSSDFIKRSVTNVQAGALNGAALAVLVLLFFLQNVRATLIIATAIPISVLATFALMYFAGFTLNVVSFGGLALGIGMLVDNAIVILENIHRKLGEGLPPAQAAVDGAREVVPAVVAGTLTTVAVFAPVVFVGGFAGVFFGEMAAVVSFALLCSLVVAVTLVPSVAARLLRPSGGVDRSVLGRVAAAVAWALEAVEAAYGRLIRGALRTPGAVVVAAILLLVASVRMVPMVGFELMPETDEGRIDINLELPVGTPIEKTSDVIQELERRVRGVLKEGELSSTLTAAGPENWWRPTGSHEGSIEVNLVSVSERARGVDAILADVRRVTGGIPGATVRVRKGTANFLVRLMRRGSDERLAVDIRGHDITTATALGEEVARRMRAVPGVTDARVDRDSGLQERAVRVRTARAADLGVTQADVADAVETYVLGQVATRLRQSGDEFDVRVQLQESGRERLERLGMLPIPTARGGTVRLGTLARLEPREAPSSIAREGQERITRVLGGLGERSLGAVVKDVDAALKDLAVPPGFTVAVAGEHAEQQESFSQLLIGILLAIVLVYMVMAVQFESLLHPLVIMAAVPFAFIGVVTSLVVTGTTFNINSFLGAIVLVGIVVNNAIVLVDYVNLLRREHGMELVSALVEGARRRLRPILMTTTTTVLALAPLAASTSEGSEVQGPLARVIVGGLLSSTLVTLLVVPCLYFMVARRGARRERRPVGPTAATGLAPGLSSHG